VIPTPRLNSTHPLARALANDRERYNALFEAARARHDGLDGTDALAVLADTVAPLVEEETASSMLDALYPLVLDATGRAWIGPRARQPEVGAAWTVALAGCRRQLERDPVRLATALLQALRMLAKTADAQPLRWADRLSELATRADTTDDLLNAGAVLAWREGLVRLRTAALRTSSTLPPPLALAALGVTGTPAHRDELAMALNRLRDNPWLSPPKAFEGTQSAAELAIRTVCGGFRGFGGPFVRPPTLVASSSGLIASDGDYWFRLHADVFGTAFERISDFDAVSPTDDAPTIGTSGMVRWGDREQEFPELASSKESAATGTMLAVGIPNSHRIVLIAQSPSHVDG